MKNLSNETTCYMMDTLAYGLVAGCAKNGQELTKQEIDSLSRMLFTLYCEHENLIPDYADIYSKSDIDDYEEEQYDEESEEDICDDCDRSDCRHCVYAEDTVNDINDYDDDGYEDDNENLDDNDDDIMEMFRMFEN